MNIIQWIRKMLGLTREQVLSQLQAQQYSEFEQAIAVTDVCCYVYDLHHPELRGQLVVYAGSELHPVTPKNLVSYYKLNRATRRKLHA